MMYTQYLSLVLTVATSFALKIEDVVVKTTNVDKLEVQVGINENQSISLTVDSVSSPQWRSYFYGQPLSKEDRLRVFAEEDDWKNELVGWTLPKAIWDRMPRFFRTWYRNLVFAYALYYLVGGAWVYYIYFIFGKDIFGKGNMPAFKDVKDQMIVATKAIPFYSLLPAVTEVFVEQGWTASFARISEVGIGMYFIYFAVYMLCVEFGVYWAHRLVHDIPAGYRLFHNIHHKYNKEHSLSPFAGLAFHPADGIIQALPYTITLFFIPLHFLTHELLLFMTGIWTTNIHDNIHGRCFPVMGAGYHTIHHTTYKDNYGHYTVLFDWVFGTLISPEEYQEKQNQKKK